MHVILKHKLLIGATTLALAAFAGGAYAATQSGTGSRQAFVNDVAKRLHVTTAQLDAAVKAAFLDRLNAAVAAGRLTQAQANQMKQRIEQRGRLPFFGLRGLGPGRYLGPPGLAPHRLLRPGTHGRNAPLAAAAGYLGLTRAQLLSDLASGQSLAQIAKARGKSLSGLKQAAVAPLKSSLDRAVAAGRITKAQEQQLLSRLSALISRGLVRGPMLLPGPPAGAPPAALAPAPSPGSPAA
jgi:hypothetical protein